MKAYLRAWDSPCSWFTRFKVLLDSFSELYRWLTSKWSTGMLNKLWPAPQLILLNNFDRPNDEYAARRQSSAGGSAMSKSWPTREEKWRCGVVEWDCKVEEVRRLVMRKENRCRCRIILGPICSLVYIREGEKAYVVKVQGCPLVMKIHPQHKHQGNITFSDHKAEGERQVSWILLLICEQNTSHLHTSRSISIDLREMYDGMRSGHNDIFYTNFQIPKRRIFWKSAGRRTLADLWHYVLSAVRAGIA